MHRRIASFSFLIAAICLLRIGAASADPPDVHFAIFRLDFQTYSVKGVYEATQSYRKTLKPPYTTQVGNLYFQVLPAGDFGYTKVYSRLTGQQWVYAETIWMGTGRLVNPPPLSFTQSYEHGHLAADPTSIQLMNGAGKDPDSAWVAVKDTDVIERLSALGDYEVVVYQHYYTVGVQNPATAEWFVIAYTNPPAPPDVGIEAVTWPQTLVTRNVGVKTEVTVHNFGRLAVAPSVHALIQSGVGTVYEAAVPAREVAPDSSQTLRFSAWLPADLGSHTLTLWIEDGLGVPWVDTFSDNDQQVRPVGVTSLPVFRRRPPSLAPGSYPGGIPLDLDGDGDIDVFQTDYDVKIYRNDLGQGFVDITSHFPAFPHWAREAIASDLDGDNFPELLVADQYTGPPLLLGSGGSQSYSDITSPAGLGGLDGWGGARFLDVDQDGDQDLVMKHSTGINNAYVVAVFKNEHGHFSRVQDSGLEAHTSPTSEIVPSDLDQDGHPDLILVNWDSPSEVFRNDGSGHFSIVAGPWSSVILGRSAVAFDPDKDGDLDILILARYDGSEQSGFFENRGNFNFVDATGEFGDLAAAFSAAVGDLDGNGYPDVVLGDIDDKKLVLLNEGGHFTKHSELITNGGLHEMINLLDVDLDGDLDICDTWEIHYFSYFENMGLDPSQHVVGVHLTSLTARRDGAASVIQWSLSDDLDVSDFQVYRSSASAPEKHNISGTVKGGKRAYEFLDTNPPAERTSYWVAEVNRTGGLNWFGPVIVESAGLNRLSVSQNSPNPFSLSTRIAFSLPERMPVRLNVYNVEGRVVRVLTDQEFPQGETAVFWDGRDQQGKMTSSGIYYYRFETGKKSFTHRMIKIH